MSTTTQTQRTPIQNSNVKTQSNAKVNSNVETVDAGSDIFAARLRAIENKTMLNAFIFKLDKPEKPGKENKAQVRILPYPFADNDFPFIEAFFHYNVGDIGTVACPKDNFGEECAICDHVSKLYARSKKIARKYNIDSKNRDKMRANTQINNLWDEAGPLRVKKRVYCPVIVQSVNDKEPDESALGVKFYGMSSGLFEKEVLRELAKPRKYQPTDRFNGKPFVFSMVNDKSDYGKAGFELLAEEEQSPILIDKTPQEINEFVSDIPNIWDVVLKRKSSEEVSKILQDYLSDTEDDSEDNDESEMTMRSQINGAARTNSKDSNSFDETSEEADESIEATSDLDGLLD